MRVLLIAIGNRLRRDDGVAHAVLERLGSAHDLNTRALLQLTPEVAAEIADYESVIFIDADTRGADVSIEPLRPLPWSPVLTHVSSPREVVALSRSLFGFAGQVFQCRIPVDDLSVGDGLSPRANMLVSTAAEGLEILLDQLGL